MKKKKLYGSAFIYTFGRMKKKNNSITLKALIQANKKKYRCMG
jgi:hypothetical protein